MRKALLTFLMINSIAFAQTAQSWTDDLVLTPERSNYEKTSTHADVISFLNAIKTKSNNIKITSIGKSTGGKDIPLVILSRTGISTPAEAKGKFVTYIQANIHGGEVEGKEAMMMMMRDILLGKKSHLLDNQVILIVPIYNTDGNDKMAKGLRPSQENSPLETGERENGQGLDLNRDGIKMETPESQGMIQNIITAWDPQMSVDLHTTNGTWHAYSLTWAPSYQYAGEPSTYNYTNGVMLPFITKTVKEKYGMFFSPYGDYNTREGWPLKNFYTYNHHPRYIVNQFGLRNRMAVLSEAFSHERFYQRIYSTYTFVFEILDYCNKHGKEIAKINHDAELAAVKNVIDNAGKAKKGVRFKMVPTAKKLNGFRTYDYTSFTKADGTRSLLRKGNIVTYDSITYYGEFKDTVQSTVPRGYIIPAAMSLIAEQLKRQGAKVTQLEKDEELSGEVFTIEKYTRGARKFEGHYMASAEGKFSPATRTAHAGDYKIDLAQPLANLIFYMLEPQSDDGLLTWNFFDTYLDQNDVKNKAVEFPVFKYSPKKK
ncbi:M14 family metallopeptidase [Sediminibacterium roseum]|uniref:M14 family metallopeptidase n=1 Tax=Sediminibacterium roseum TaxID=1978412 RepID=A0ABW9ZZ80_9BACT|nr:M14 family metallopeptidase [Sediminibacterium roseum]NCI51027.1 M14 family metallopeptidase [Sediminibacterium roseum]